MVVTMHIIFFVGLNDVKSLKFIIIFNKNKRKKIYNIIFIIYMLLKLNSKLSFNSEIVFANSPIFYILYSHQLLYDFK